MGSSVPSPQFDSPEGAGVFWHSASHLLGLAIEREYSPATGEHAESSAKVQLCDGPALSDEKGGLGSYLGNYTCVCVLQLLTLMHLRS